MKTRSPWSGRVFIGIGRVIYIGAAGDTSPHVHHALQVCVALGDAFRLRHGPGSNWKRYRGAIIPSDEPHHLDGSGCEVVVVFLEPESEGGRRLAVGRPGGSIQAIAPGALRAVRAASAATRSGEISPEAAARLCQHILVKLGVRLEPREVLDDRVRRALEAIRADPTRRWKAAEMAEAVGLSSRRFREVFTSQVGMSFRPFLLWHRVYSALQQLAGGASLTEAALAAGFADAAHLTRSFRRMVGIVPSAIARSVSFMETLQRD